MLTFNQRRGIFLVVFALMCAFAAMTTCNHPALAEEAIESVDDEPLCAVEDIEQDEARLYRWERIWGSNALETMQQVLRTDGVFERGRGGSVLVATASNYKDALACAGLAGALDSPILITNGKSLSWETREEVRRLMPDKIFVVGGTSAVSANVERDLAQYADVKRVAGKSAVGTAHQLFRNGWLNEWGKTAIVVTGNGYKDALSIAPYAYWSHSPVFLTRASSNPDNRILPGNALSDIAKMACRPQGIERVIIVGGTVAVSADVEKMLDNLGVKHIRLWGKDAIGTSAQCAQYAIYEGMSTAHLTVATTKSYKDALCAAPLCGQLGSVMVLCNPEGGLVAFDEVCDQSQVAHGHVLGGIFAIGERNWRHIDGGE